MYMGFLKTLLDLYGGETHVDDKAGIFECKTIDPHI